MPRVPFLPSGASNTPQCNVFSVQNGRIWVVQDSDFQRGVLQVLGLLGALGRDLGFTMGSLVSSNVELGCTSYRYRFRPRQCSLWSHFGLFKVQKAPPFCNKYLFSISCHFPLFSSTIIAVLDNQDEPCCSIAMPKASWLLQNPQLSP